MQLPFSLALQKKRKNRKKKVIGEETSNIQPSTRIFLIGSALGKLGGVLMDVGTSCGHDPDRLCVTN